jgi:hypothetical protein
LINLEAIDQRNGEVRDAVATFPIIAMQAGLFNIGQILSSSGSCDAIQDHILPGELKKGCESLFHRLCLAIVESRLCVIRRTAHGVCLLHLAMIGSRPPVDLHAPSMPAWMKSGKPHHTIHAAITALAREESGPAERRTP